MSARREHARVLGGVGLLALAASGWAGAHEIDAGAAAGGIEEIAADADGEDDGPRGRISLAYQFQDTEGLITQDGSVRGTTTTDMHSVRLGIDYRLNDDWQLHASVPFMRKRSSGGPGAHRLDILTVPHPEASFLDDGNFHSGWQDFSLGVSRHGAWRGYTIVPQATLVLPTHDYSHFGNAAIGQNQKKLALGIDVSRAIGFSDFYWSLGYSYELVEQVLGISLNKHHARSALGYFFSPRTSARVFVNARDGQGRETGDFTDRTSEFWYQHDRLTRHDYVIAGLAATWQATDDYAVTLTGVRLVRGRNVHNLRSAYEIQFSRRF